MKQGLYLYVIYNLGKQNVTHMKYFSAEQVCTNSRVVTVNVG